VFELPLLNWFRKKARECPAREDGNRLIFPVTMPARIFFGPGALLMVTAQIAAFFILGIPLWEMVLPHRRMHRPVDSGF